ETSKIWRQALSPFAEWIAKTLWTVTPQQLKAKAPATRLTQNHKREAKGFPIQTPRNTLFPNRTAERSVQSLNEIKLVRLTRSDPIAGSRRAEALQRQNAALKAWTPSQRPKWLNEGFYKARIQRQLSVATVSTIASELGISESYATRIRAGRCIPH